MQPASPVLRAVLCMFFFFPRSWYPLNQLPSSWWIGLEVFWRGFPFRPGRSKGSNPKPPIQLSLTFLVSEGKQQGQPFPHFGASPKTRHTRMKHNKGLPTFPWPGGLEAKNHPVVPSVPEGWPWVKIQVVPPVNINQSPRKKIKINKNNMGGAPAPKWYRWF